MSYKCFHHFEYFVSCVYIASSFMEKRVEQGEGKKNYADNETK